MHSAHYGELVAVFTAVLWTLSTVAWTSAGKHVGALPISFVRLVFASVFLSVHGLVFRGLILPTDVDSTTWGWLLASGFFGFFVADVCLFKAFLIIGPRLALLINALGPPIAAIISWFCLGDQMTAVQMLGMAVTLSGVCWVVMEQPPTPREAHVRRHFAMAVGLALTSAVASAVSNVLTKAGVSGCDPSSGTYIRVLGAIPAFILLITVMRRWPAIVKAVKNVQAMAICACGTTVGPYFGVICSLEAIHYCHVGVASTIINTMPVLILPFSIFVYKEKVSWRAGLGAVVTVVGMGLLAWK